MFTWQFHWSINFYIGANIFYPNSQTKGVLDSVLLNDMSSLLFSNMKADDPPEICGNSPHKDSIEHLLRREMGSSGQSFVAIVKRVVEIARSHSVAAVFLERTPVVYYIMLISIAFNLFSTTYCRSDIISSTVNS